MDDENCTCCNNTTNDETEENLDDAKICKN